jgi:hypothetical protein
LSCWQVKVLSKSLKATSYLGILARIHQVPLSTHSMHRIPTIHRHNRGLHILISNRSCKNTHNLRLPALRLLPGLITHRCIIKIQRQLTMRIRSTAYAPIHNGNSIQVILTTNKLTTTASLKYLLVDAIQRQLKPNRILAYSLLPRPNPRHTNLPNNMFHILSKALSSKLHNLNKIAIQMFKRYFAFTIIKL